MQLHDAAHHLDEIAHERQPEPGTAELARRTAVALHEAVEHLGLALGLHADACVANLEAHEPSGLGCHTAQRDGAVLRELDGVVHQVAQHLVQALLVGAHRQRFVLHALGLQHQSTCPGARGHLGHDARQRAGDRHGLVREHEPSGLDARHVEDVLDERAQLHGTGMCLAHRDALFLGVVAQAVRDQPEEAEDAIERRAQLVRGVRQELVFEARGLAQPLVAVGQLGVALLDAAAGGEQRLRHVIEPVGEQRQFVVTRVEHAVRIVPGREALRALRERLDPARERIRQFEGDDRGHQQAQEPCGETAPREQADDRERLAGVAEHLDLPAFGGADVGRVGPDGGRVVLGRCGFRFVLHAMADAGHALVVDGAGEPLGGTRDRDSIGIQQRERVFALWPAGDRHPSHQGLDRLPPHERHQPAAASLGEA